jgi:hypothetical protein
VIEDRSRYVSTGYYELGLSRGTPIPSAAGAVHFIQVHLQAVKVGRTQLPDLFEQALDIAGIAPLRHERSQSGR